MAPRLAKTPWKDVSASLCPFLPPLFVTEMFAPALPPAPPAPPVTTPGTGRSVSCVRCRPSGAGASGERCCGAPRRSTTLSRDGNAPPVTFTLALALPLAPPEPPAPVAPAREPTARRSASGRRVGQLCQAGSLPRRHGTHQRRPPARSDRRSASPRSRAPLRRSHSLRLDALRAPPWRAGAPLACEHAPHPRFERRRSVGAAL